MAYTAYPPSPQGERQKQKIELKFHTGTIEIGHYLVARGSYDASTNTLVVAEQGDYIETLPKKP